MGVLAARLGEQVAIVSFFLLHSAIWILPFFFFLRSPMALHQHFDKSAYSLKGESLDVFPTRSLAWCVPIVNNTRHSHSPQPHSTLLDSPLEGAVLGILSIHIIHIGTPTRRSPPVARPGRSRPAKRHLLKRMALHHSLPCRSTSMFLTCAQRKKERTRCQMRNSLPRKRAKHCVFSETWFSISQERIPANPSLLHCFTAKKELLRSISPRTRFSGSKVSMLGNKTLAIAHC